MQSNNELNDQQSIRVLVIEDDDADFILLRRLLAKNRSVNINAVRSQLVSEALKVMGEKQFDIVLSDLNVPDSSGIDTFVRIHERFPDIPVIVLTGLDDEATAIVAVQKGAQDYLVKGITDAAVLIRSMRYALERQKLVREVENNLREVRTLQGLIPICAWCRQIRDDGGYWKKVETYIQEHTDAKFSHGICPDCLSNINPEAYALARKEMPELVQFNTSDISAGGMKKIKLLLVEDDGTHVEIIQREMAKAKSVRIDVVHAPSLSSALDLLATQRFDLILCDLGLPDCQGLETFRRVHARSPGTPVVVLTGRHDEGLAVEALRGGAQDYLEKGLVTGPSFERVIRHSIERQGLLSILADRVREIGTFQRERNHLLSMFAHDIQNTVMPAVVGAQQLLSDKRSEAGPDLTAIRDKLAAAEHLLTRFIDFARLEKSDHP